MAEVTTTEKKSPTVQEQMKTRETDSQAGIGKIYEGNLTSQKQALLDAYNTNTAAQAQQGQTIQQNYAGANYDIGVQNDRNAANLTQFADVRGVNTGLGSQHQLNLGNARARALGPMEFAQQQALAENQRQQELMTQTYQNQVAAAFADNDYKKAAALLDDYNNQNAWREQQAQILATYGNFEPYKDLYGEEPATAMQKVWQAQNPDVAYRTGAITAEQYKQITGKYPKGYNPGGGGGYGLPDGWWNATPDTRNSGSLISRGARVGGTPVAPGHMAGLNSATAVQSVTGKP